MDNSWDAVRHAVANKPLDDAYQYILYELKSSLGGALTAAKLLNEDHLTATNRTEVLEMTEMRLTKAIQIVDELMGDIFLRRLQPDNPDAE
jgi:hypothetical protein